MKRGTTPSKVLDVRSGQSGASVQVNPPPPAYLVVAVGAMAVLAVLVTWAAPGVDGDLFVALAGGRDVATGQLGRPDAWSSLTVGRVWINQNWLSHLLIYLAWRVAGQPGLLVLKATLISAMAAFVYRLGLRRGSPWPIALLLAAVVTACCADFAFLRANLSTLVMVPLILWLLHYSIDKRHCTWWVLPAIVLWANLHGGFVFGLGMVGLWAICITLEDWRRDGKNPLAQDWPLWACSAACIVAAAVSPFGLENLTHPLVIASSKAWRVMGEWQSVFASPMPTPRAFFVVLGVTAALAMVRLLALPFERIRKAATVMGKRPGPSPSAGDSGSHGPSRHPTPESRVPTLSACTPSSACRYPADDGGHGRQPIIFDTLLTMIAVFMGFQSQRLVAVALLVMAAPLAWLVPWAAGRLGRKGIPLLAACALGAVASPAYRDVVMYWPGNPVHRGTSVFDRMHFVPFIFPVSAARFLADNDLTGNVLTDWTSEGYVRWICPKAKPLIGGRAQQVFSEGDLAAYLRLEDPRVAPDWLRQKQVHLAVLTVQDSRSRRVMFGLLDSGRWGTIFSDGQSQVLADIETERALVQRAIDGQLKYPSEPIRILSRALCLSSVRTSADPADLFAAARQANAVLPAAVTYMVVADLGCQSAFHAGVVRYLEEELGRLSRLPETPDNHLAILNCRLMAQDSLAMLYGAEGRQDAATAAKHRAGILRQELSVLLKTWAY